MYLWLKLSPYLGLRHWRAQGGSEDAGYAIASSTICEISCFFVLYSLVRLGIKPK